MAKHLMIEGRVQGVGYRYAFSERAAELGLAGWVRNRSNGAVEACVDGPADALDAIIAWAHHGPASARVSKVTVANSAGNGALPAQFEIRPTA